MTKIRVTQVKSTIGRPQSQKDTMRALGIRKMHQTVVIEAKPEMLGMVRKISHLVNIVEDK